ncbi:hypothetical protein FIBSPDRAFT_1040456 [Athelia psychrophila]|uniref:ABC transporter TMD0 domain-containing protein n=1 Tax=Athelia psychrophila TaxID=1759441 RepID=A0A166QBL0_9AGAM|nr:hypothetical protein FIBSPDRAFT_1040456 [Fibularhizoctonia sp. CBS 109695]
MLCSNRYPLPGSPSTCIIDTALVPLPSFLLIAFGGLFLWRRRRDQARTTTPKWLHILYMVLVIASIAMTVLELARDSADDLGVGLIPVVLVGLILVFVGLCVEFKGRSQPLSMLFFAYWLLNIIFQSIKVARLSKLEKLFPVHTQYPASDQFLDNAVIVRSPRICRANS